MVFYSLMTEDQFTVMPEAICAVNVQEFEDATDCMNAATNGNEFYECVVELIDDADMDTVVPTGELTCEQRMDAIITGPMTGTNMSQEELMVLAFLIT